MIIFGDFSVSATPRPCSMSQGHPADRLFVTGSSSVANPRLTAVLRFHPTDVFLKSEGFCENTQIALAPPLLRVFQRVPGGVTDAHGVHHKHHGRFGTHSEGRFCVAPIFKCSPTVCVLHFVNTV